MFVFSCNDAHKPREGRFWSSTKLFSVECMFLVGVQFNRSILTVGSQFRNQSTICIPRHAATATTATSATTTTTKLSIMTSTDSTPAKNALGYPLLQCKNPVPCDIQISQDIVKDVGLLSIADLAKQYVYVIHGIIVSLIDLVNGVTYWSCCFAMVHFNIS